MSDLRCRKCGMEASFADANIADIERSCGVEAEPSNANRAGRYGGERHDWFEI